MEQIAAIIERASDGTYSVYCKHEIFSGMGSTLKEAKADMEGQMAVYRETAIEQGFKYPSFLDGEYEVAYEVDAVSLLNYYIGSGLFTLTSLEKLTGINQKQLWAYTSGTRPRKAQADRINAGFRRLSEDLDAIFA